MDKWIWKQAILTVTQIKFVNKKQTFSQMKNKLNIFIIQKKNITKKKNNCLTSQINKLLK